MYPIVSENAHYRVTEQYFVMSDNIGLYTRIIAPQKREKCPIVFIRSPYVLNHSGIPYDIEQCEADDTYGIFLKHGYAVVFQHCRGCGISEGICIPYSDEERRDGLESLELIRNLSVYDGEIYLFGGSYLASVHYLYLSTNPHDIKAAALHIQTDRMFFINMRNGCRYTPTCEWWLKRAIRKYPHQKYGDEFRRPYRDIAKRVVGFDVPEYNKLLMSIEYDDFWKNDPRTNLMDELKIPILFTEGWYDFYNYGMFSMWERLNPETKKKSLFAVGPWGHSTKMSSAPEYAMPNGNLPEDFWVEWFNSFRYNRPFKYGECGKVKYYNIGADEWKISEYPKKSKKKSLYLCKCNKLNTNPCTEDFEITYEYNPDKNQDYFKFQNIFKASAPNTRDDVISFFSDEFTETESFFGSVKFHIDVSSDCEDTAFFMRLYLVENGEAYNLTEEISSISFADKDYTPGKKVCLDLFSPPIAFTVKQGSSLRVDISSSCKNYVNHANVKGHWAEIAETKIAHNTLHLNGAYIELSKES